MPSTYAAMKRDAGVLGQPYRGARRPSRRLEQRGDSRDGNIVRDSRTPIGDSSDGVPQTAAYSRLALAAGQDRLWIDRVIVKPSATIRSSPTSRVSPWAMVLVAIRPRFPAASAEP